MLEKYFGCSAIDTDESEKSFAKSIAQRFNAQL